MSIDIHTHATLPTWMTFLPRFSSSSRVPDDSDSESGVIKQRQNCLESRRVEGQEMPVLTLAPCVGTQGVPAINQVGRRLQTDGLPFGGSPSESVVLVFDKASQIRRQGFPFPPQRRIDSFIRLISVFVFPSCIRGAVCSAGSVTKT